MQAAFERVHAHFATVVAELDLAPVQAKALHELNLEPPISMRALAERDQRALRDVLQRVLSLSSI